MKNIIFFFILGLSIAHAQVVIKQIESDKDGTRNEVILINGDSIDVNSKNEKVIVIDKANANLSKILKEYNIKDLDQKDGNKKIIIINKKSNDQDINIQEDENVKNELTDFPHFSEVEQNIKSNKAVLGVHVNNAKNDNGAEITQIMSGSGAELAGLETGDIILKINGHKVQNSDELIDRLSGLKVGEKVKVGILRNADIIKKTVILSKPSEAKFEKACCVKDIKDCKKKMIIIDKREMENMAKDNNDKIEVRKFIIEDKDQTKESNAQLQVSVLTGKPNPNQGQMTISFTGEKEPFEVKVLDLTGKEIYSEKVEDHSGEYHKEILLDKSTGTLVIQVMQGKKLTTAKVIVQ